MREARLARLSPTPSPEVSPTPGQDDSRMTKRRRVDDEAGCV